VNVGLNKVSGGRVLRKLLLVARPPGSNSQSDLRLQLHGVEDGADSQSDLRLQLHGVQDGADSHSDLRLQLHGVQTAPTANQIYVYNYMG